MTSRQLLASCSALAFLACSETPMTPRPSAEPNLGTSSLPAAGARGATFMTRNLYLGADFGRVISAGPNLVNVVAETWGIIQSTDFPSRAEALALEIATASPHIVGLQEVVTYRTRIPFNPATPATQVELDFLSLLLQALERQGASYYVAARQELTDVEVPALDFSSPTFLKGIRYTDHDVILARSDVVVSNAAGGVYSNLHQYTVAGMPLASRRGWVAVTASLAGNTYRVFNSHLEVQSAAETQLKQAREMLELVAAHDGPVVLLGDFNSAADGSQTGSYGALIADGFVDVWSQAHPRDPGYTCCFAEDLRGFSRTLDQRIDFVLVRDHSWPHARILGGVHAAIVGQDPGLRTSSGLWPSDHAGVVATLTSPPR